MTKLDTETTTDAFTITVTFKADSPEEQVFSFRQPKRDEVNQALSKMRQKVVDGNHNLALACVKPEQKQKLADLLKEQFGFAVVAGGKILESVGFTQD